MARRERRRPFRKRSRFDKDWCAWPKPGPYASASSRSRKDLTSRFTSRLTLSDGMYSSYATSRLLLGPPRPSRGCSDHHLTVGQPCSRVPQRRWF
jgi:hypothetical protein